MLKSINSTNDYKFLKNDNLEIKIDKLLELGYEKILESDLSLLNKKEIDRTATVKYIDGKLLIGIAIEDEQEISTDPKVGFKFKRNELGPSGGLMTALKIYDMLTQEDITRGYKISGTGTIDEEGNVGEISGIKYKLAGAYKKGSQIFICPTGNYKECEYEKNKNKYNIKLIEGDNFNNVLKVLRELPHYDK